FEVLALALRLHGEMILASARAARRFKAQLQTLGGVRNSFDRGDWLAAAKDRRLPPGRYFGHSHRQLLRRQLEIADRQVERRRLSGLHGERRVSRREKDAGEV